MRDLSRYFIVSCVFRPQIGKYYQYHAGIYFLFLIIESILIIVNVAEVSQILTSNLNEYGYQ